MITSPLDAWLALLARSCEQANAPCLDVIVDQAGGPSSVLASVRAVEPPLPWRSLFSGLPEAGAEHFAPLLLRIDLANPLQRQWFAGLLRNVKVESQILVLASHWPFPALAHYLGRCVEANNGGCLGLLRYYDPRLFALLFSHVLAPDQQQLLLRPAVFWSWLDRDGQPQRQVGNHGAPVAQDDFRVLELTDSQVDTLGCASDAASLLRRVPPHTWGRLSAQQRSHACYLAMLAATEAGLIGDPEREAFVLAKLQAERNGGAS